MSLHKINQIFRSNKIIQSFVIIPLMASSVSMATFTASVTDTMQLKETAQEEQKLSQEEQVQLKVERERAAKIDAYFKKNNMPLAGYGDKFVQVAKEHNLDWRLLPAIATREQGGGRVLPYNCPNKTKNYNAFGWASGKVCFTSFDTAIETVGFKLATLSFYKGKSVEGILKTYNPPHVVPTYSQEVMGIMSTIEKTTI